MSRLLSDIRYRLRTVFNRDAVERELDDEMRFHIEKETEKLVGQGVPRAEAERRARVAFGGVERMKEETRDSHGTAAIDGILQDLRYAVRGLRARPAFTIGILATLGLGIGANTVMFGIVDRVLVRGPAMMRSPDEVHRIYRYTVESGNQDRYDRNFAFPTYLDLRKELTSFSDVAAFQTIQVAVGESADVRQLRVTVASASYFNFFAARPALGRFFTASEDTLPTGANVAVLGYDYWQTQYAGRDVTGEQIRIGRVLCTIIGVAPKGFAGMSDQGMPVAYVPITAYAYWSRPQNFSTRYGWSWLETIARRKPGVDPAAAEANAHLALTRSWQNAFAQAPGWGTPESNKLRGMVGPVQFERGPMAGRDSRVAIWVGGVALIVLLIACANVANLMLARAVSRRREIAMRLALGVSRARLTRQLLTESLLLAAAGGAAAIAIAQWGGAAIRRLFLPPEFGDAVLTDPRTLTFTAVATLVAALLTGLVPAWNAGREDVVTALKAGSREGDRRSKTRSGLLVFQAALSVLLLVGAGLFVRSLNNARGLRLGYDTDSVVVATVNLRGATLDSAQIRALIPRFTDAARGVPGISRVGFSAAVPFQSNDQMPIFVPGVDTASNKGRFLVQFVDHEYLGVMGTRVLKGRGLEATDGAAGERVVVIGEGMAKLFWPGQDAVGQCFRFNTIESPCMRIVGVIEDVRHRSFIDPREHSYYVPVAQYPSAQGDLALFARTAVGQGAVAATLRARLQETLPQPAYVTVRPMSAMVEPNYRSWNFGATMFTAFGILALVLAAVGLYSLVAYDVAQRTRDMSVRLALGASGPSVVGLVVGGGVRLVAIGVAIGALVAFQYAPAAQAMMYKQEARDPAVFIAVGSALLIVGALAALIPAIRASRVDPALMLRAD